MQSEFEVASKRKNHLDASGHAVMAIEFKQKDGMASMHLYMPAAEAKQYELDDAFTMTLERKAAGEPAAEAAA